MFTIHSEKIVEIILITFNTTKFTVELELVLQM